MELHPVSDKLREAEFFFMLMEKHFDSYEFRYFLSAFLSALFSCTEHNRLMSADPRFKSWHREMKTTHLSHKDLRNLQEMRRHEVHLKGKEIFKVISFNFPDGITVKSREELVMDFSIGQSVGRYKIGRTEELKEYPVRQRWVWMTENEPDVMDLCDKGLQVVRKVIESRNNTGFRDEQ